MDLTAPQFATVRRWLGAARREARALSAAAPNPIARRTSGHAADAKAFLAELRREVEAHEAVNHPLLARLAHVPFRREDYRVMGLQHYALVGTFTTYLEMLLLRAPSSEAKSWIAKVLVDEYGEGSEGKDHAELYREYLRAAGAAEGEEQRTPLHEAVTGFVAEHLRICREEPFLVGLGAIGPGHEWAIPRMFHQIIRGLRQAAFREEEIGYFTLHVLQDEDHGAWLEEALELYAADPEGQAQIERGTLLSLAARARFWSGVEDKVVRWRQPENVHLRTEDRSGAYREGGQLTLASWRARIRSEGLTTVAP